MYFAGASPNSLVQNNSLNSGARANEIGMNLNSTCILGPQGNARQPYYNSWTSGFHCNSLLDASSIPNQSIFFVQGGVYNPDGGTGTCSKQILISLASGTAPSCAPVLHSPIDTVMTQIARNTVVFTEYPDTTTVLAKQALTNVLWNDPTLLSDSIMNHFNDSISNASMGQLLAADTLQSDTVMSNLGNSLNTFNSITPANNIESNLQAIAQIHLNSRINQHDSLSPTQLNSLRILASKCPFKDGIAVYRARAILAPYDGIKVYSNSCENDENDRRAIASANSEPDSLVTSQLNIYPNPNNGTFTLDYQLADSHAGKVMVFNTMGEMVGQYDLTTAVGKMTITNPYLTNGIYIYELYTNNQLMKVGKVIIIK
jgi:hypothetical protein